MNKQQTAVEWLVKMLYSPVGKGFIEGRRQIPHDIIEQAKAMEEKQHNLIYKRGYVNGIGDTQLTNSVMKNK